MDYLDYVERTRRAANLIDSGQFDQAIEILENLINSDISEIDKSMMCVNLAVVCDKQKRLDQALTWYDRGIAFERPFLRVFVAMQKAGYLATKGFPTESRDLYIQLYSMPYLSESERETVRRNIQTLSSASS